MLQNDQGVSTTTTNKLANKQLLAPGNNNQTLNAKYAAAVNNSIGSKQKNPVLVNPIKDEEETQNGRQRVAYLSHDLVTAHASAHTITEWTAHRQHGLCGL